MHESVMEFGRRVLQSAEVEDAWVLEVGSMNLNGSLRAHVQALQPAHYLGIDLRWGPGVDARMDFCVPLPGPLPRRFDLVLCTEMLEHAQDWRVAVSNLKRAVRPHGILLLTTRSRGFPYHEHPGDFWRFELADMRHIFGDMEILILEPDPGGPGGGPGVFLKARMPDPFAEVDLSRYTVYSMEAER